MERIRPLRLRLHTVAAGDSWASLAQQASQGSLAPAALAVLNGSSPDVPPLAGARVKIVR